MCQPAVIIICKNLQNITDFWRVFFSFQVKLFHTATKEIVFGCFCLVILPTNLKFDLFIQAVRMHCIQPYNWSPDTQRSSAMTSVCLQTRTFRRNCGDKDVRRVDVSTWQKWSRYVSPVGSICGIWHGKLLHPTDQAWNEVSYRGFLSVMHKILPVRSHSTKNSLHNFLSAMEYHRGQSFAPCYSSCIPLTLVTSLLVMDYRHIFMHKTHSWCSLNVEKTDILTSRLIKCIDEIDAWTASNCLKRKTRIRLKYYGAQHRDR